MVAEEELKVEIKLELDKAETDLDELDEELERVEKERMEAKEEPLTTPVGGREQQASDKRRFGALRAVGAGLGLGVVLGGLTLFTSALTESATRVFRALLIEEEKKRKEKEDARDSKIQVVEDSVANVVSLLPSIARALGQSRDLVQARAILGVPTSLADVVDDVLKFTQVDQVQSVQQSKFDIAANRQIIGTVIDAARKKIHP